MGAASTSTLSQLLRLTPADQPDDAEARRPKPGLLRTRLQFLARSLMPAVALLAWGSAMGAGSVRYEVRDPENQRTGTMAIEWLDTQNVRMDISAPDMPKGTQAYTLLRGDKLYSVNIGDGQTMVMEMGPMLRMAGRLAQASGQADALDDLHEVKDLRATGRKEVVAGVTGEVYLLSYLDEKGKPQQTEVVLSANRTVFEMSQAMMALAGQMAAATEQTAKPGRSDLEQRLRQQNLGLLRMGDQMRAVQVSDARPASQRFELPAPPMAMPDLSGLAGLMSAAKGAAQQKAPAEPAEPANPGIAERQATRQQQRVEERTQSEVDNTADKAVDKVLNRLFDRLRNR